MDRTQFAIFEISPACNFATKHAKCPSASPERFATANRLRSLSDDQIAAAAQSLYRDFGFRGMIGWHYYNEPLLSWDRLRPLMARIQAETPEARFILWTNGVHLPVDGEGLEAFSAAWVTDYGGNIDARALAALRAKCPRVTVPRWQLDERLTPEGAESLAPCRRPFSEIVFDYHGRCHLCCVDWRGQIDLGNFFDAGLAECVRRFRAARDAVAAEPMAKDAPALCRRCRLRNPSVSPLVPEIAAAASALLRAAPPPSPDASKHAVVVWTSDAEATAALREAAKAGAYFGLVLRRGETLEGDAAAALALHPRENILRVRVERDGVRVGDRRFVRLRDLGEVRDGVPRLARVRRAEIELAELRVVAPPLPAAGPRHLAVTFTSYRIPERRLRDHFAWNDAVYRAHGATVFAVVDREYEDLPDYVRPLVYPDAMEKFNLAKTSNYGIRRAIESGYSVVVKSDVDMFWPTETFARCASVAEGEAVVPLYRMAHALETRETKFDVAPGATGTVALTAAGWRSAHFDERCVGYGCDDGILQDRIRDTGLRVVGRELPIYHIAHAAGTPQKEFRGRSDHWNRADGFNPENFQVNRKYHHVAADADPLWGVPESERSRRAGVVAVVVTHYAKDGSIPTKRLAEFLEWNAAEFARIGARVFVVAEGPRPGLPPWAECLVYPRELSRFCLAKTSNYGIRRAIDAGFRVVVKTDVDCVFSAAASEEIERLAPGRGLAFCYAMIDRQAEVDALLADKDARRKKVWQASKGTLALSAEDWRKMRGYDERMEGYGVEDGDAFSRAGSVAKVELSDAPFFHVAHSAAPQSYGNTRQDCYGRASGFSPRNHDANRAALRAGPWASEHWGLADL